MPETSVRTLPRIARRESGPWPALNPPGHQGRILSLRDHYARLGLSGRTVGPGTPRRVRAFGRVYPSVAAAAKAIGCTDAAIHVAIGRDGICHGIKVAWAE